MNLDLFIAQWQEKISAWWYSLSPDSRYQLWIAGGAVLFLAWLWFAHRFMRWLLGHSRFRGTWYNEEQFEVLVKMIDEDCQRGNRVMRHDEMQVLRRWRFGSTKSISARAKGYF